MASGRMAQRRYFRDVFIVLVGLLATLRNVNSYSPRIEVTCKAMVDLENLGYEAGLLVSRLPERIPIYANEEERCDVYVSIPINWELMFYFDWLDLYSGDINRCDTTSLELFDGSPNQFVTGLDRPICGHEDEMPRNMYFVYKNFFILRVNALSSIQGSGFRIHFTRYRRAIPCSNQEFTCDTFGVERCIAEHLVCDQWNDCGDWLDEERDCPDLAPGAIAGLIVAIIIIILVVVGLIIFCHIRKRRERAMIEKEDSMLRDNSNRTLNTPFTVSRESIEKKDAYIPRYNSAKRGSGRGGRNTPDPDEYEEYPPPYTEKPLRNDDSRSDLMDPEDDAPRVRRSQKSRNARESSLPEEVFGGEEEDAPRVRRPKSKGPEADRPPSRSRDERPPARDDLDRSRDDRYPPKDDFGSRPRSQRPSSVDDLDRSRKERTPSREDLDGRSRDDRYPYRRDDRDDDRYPPRDDRYPRDDRSSRRDPDRDRDPRDRRSSRRDAPRSTDGDSSDTDPVDQLHPLRALTRSFHSGSEVDSDNPLKLQDLDDRSRRSRKEKDERPPSSYNDAPGSRRDREREDRAPPLRSEPPSSRKEPPSSRNEPPSSRYQPPASRSEPPSSRNEPPVSRRDREPEIDRRRNEPASQDSWPPPPPDVAPVASLDDDDEEDEDAPRRRRRRRSRSREDRDRAKSGPGPTGGVGRNGEEGAGRKSVRPVMPPVVPLDMDSDASSRQSGPGRKSRPSYREEAV